MNNVFGLNIINIKCLFQNGILSIEKDGILIKKEKEYRHKTFSDNYKHTPEILIVGDQIFGLGYFLI